MYRTFAHNPINMQTLFFESESIAETFKFVRCHKDTCTILTFGKDNSILDWSKYLK